MTGLELGDRAVRFLEARDDVAEDELLAHVYGAPIPAALRGKLAAPLLSDARLERQADGRWTLRQMEKPAAGARFTALAVAATGPTPGRARVVRIVALHVLDEQVVERFDATVNPGRHVPHYVAERMGLEPEALNDQPTFGDILDELVRFLGLRPIIAQDVQLTWGFIAAEARLCGRALAEPALVDLNELAARRLAMKGKPTLGLIAAHLGTPSGQISHVHEEARIIGRVGGRLLGMGPLDERDAVAVALRRSDTARALPDEPGVYVLRDAEQQALYVGKARRLRSRMAAYVHRPLGPTRRLEGLVGAVNAVDATQCQTDLEALILEDREIRRLQPRFNTVRQQRAPRYWIRRPPAPTDKKHAPPRLELSLGPGTAEGEFVGPFRNEQLAEQARLLAREVFELDSLRRTAPGDYFDALAAAWRFLHGESAAAEALARHRCVTLLRKVVGFDLAPMLLPADPRHARYAVVRPGPNTIEGFLLDRGIFVAFGALGDDVHAFACALLEPGEPRTSQQDSDVVLRWFATQRPPARLVCLPEDPLAATDAIEDAVYALVPEA